jgi:molybdate transport system ATP-binding protein
MSLSVDATIARDGFSVTCSFDADAGETLGLLGPNGSGKSSVVAALAGLLASVDGRIELDGTTLDQGARVHVPADRRPVGVAFQDRLLFPHLSAGENAAFPLRARGVPRGHALQRVTELLTDLGFPLGRIDARPAMLSGGEAQRVAIARALIHQPRLLLLDEPTSALDVRARSELRPVIRSILGSFEGIRVLVTHDPIEAMSLADRIVVLEEGRVTQTGTPAELREAPRTPYVAELVGVNLFAGSLRALGGGAGRLATPDGDVVVAWPAGAADSIDGVLGVLRPADVSLHADRPGPGSARNVLHGPVVGIAVEGERARVRLGSRPSVVAEVTLGSVTRLGLREGNEAWASFKAVEVEVRLPSEV